MPSLAAPTAVMAGVLKLIVDPLDGDEIVRAGGVLSNFSVTVALAIFPALSTAVPVIT